jgi:transposase
MGGVRDIRLHVAAGCDRLHGDCGLSSVLGCTHLITDDHMSTTLSVQIDIDTKKRLEACGQTTTSAQETSMWMATQDPPRSAAHQFYTRLNQILDRADFDRYVEALCQRFYADDVGRPRLPPGRYFRLLLIGYFEALDAERAIAWCAPDSLALREFLALVLPEAPPDHSTISRTRRLIDRETHRDVFTWVLQRLVDAGLVKGTTIDIDATTLEANAALRSIVRRDTGATYQEFLTQLAQTSGIETPTREDLSRIDGKRPKRGSADDWTHPLDPDAKITKMKDGRTVGYNLLMMSITACGWSTIASCAAWSST